jgi:hypothetical protein
VGEGILQFQPRATVPEVIDGFTFASRNIVAQLPGNKAHQWRVWKASKASVVQKALFEFKEVELKEIQQFMLAL